MKSALVRAAWLSRIGELHRRHAAHAVGIVVRARRSSCCRRCGRSTSCAAVAPAAEVEGAGRERAGRGQRGEDGILQLDRVLRREVGDVVDIGRGVERGVEEEVSAAVRAGEDVVADAARSACRCRRRRRRMLARPSPVSVSAADAAIDVLDVPDRVLGDAADLHRGVGRAVQRDRHRRRLVAVVGRVEARRRRPARRCRRRRGRYWPRPSPVSVSSAEPPMHVLDVPDRVLGDAAHRHRGVRSRRSA